MTSNTVSVAAALLLASPTLALSQETLAVEKIDQLTMEEKASLTTGQNTWETFADPPTRHPGHLDGGWACGL